MKACSLEPVERVLFESSTTPLAPELIDLMGWEKVRERRAWDELTCLQRFLTEQPLSKSGLVRPVSITNGTRYIEDDDGRPMSYYLEKLRKIAKVSA